LNGCEDGGGDETIKAVVAEMMRGHAARDRRRQVRALLTLIDRRNRQ